MLPRVPDPDLRKERVNMYADLAGNREKHGIKSLCDNKGDCEGRFIYDCFVLNEKADAVYYHGSQAVLKDLIVTTAATAQGKSTILVTAELEGAKRYYKTAATVEGLPAVAHGNAISIGEWTEMTGGSVEITPESGNIYVRVVEVDAADKPIAVGTTNLNIG